jgi:hypothetical protein
MVLNFYLEDLVTSEEFISLLEQVLLGLLNGILSLLDNDNNSEGPDPDDPDPEGEDPYPGGEDPDDDRPDKPNNDDSDPDKGDSYPDQDSPPTKRVDKGKGRASTPEPLPDSPRIFEEPLVPEEDDDEESFQKDLEKAKANSLKIDREKGGGESSKQGGQQEIEEQDIKQEVKGQYNKAVQDFNHNQGLLVDNDKIEPSVKQFLIDNSQKLRVIVDHYKTLKEDLGIESSEEESGSEYDSEDSDSENSRPSKRPKNK